MHNRIRPGQGAVCLAQIGEIGQSIAIGPAADTNMIYTKHLYARLSLGIFDRVAADESF